MRSLLWVTFASFVVYNAAILPSAIRGSFPSVGSYMYGLLIFMGPFVALLLASAVGLKRPVANFCAGIGALVLVLVGWLVATNQALFVAPAFLMIFGAFSVVVLLFASGVRLVRSLISRVSRT